MYSTLIHHGVPTRLCLFHGENHELSRGGKPKGRIPPLAGNHRVDGQVFEGRISGTLRLLSVLIVLSACWMSYDKDQ